MITDDCPVNVGVETVTQWAACLRKAAGPAISSIDPMHPAYMTHPPVAGVSAALWITIGIVSFLFIAISVTLLFPSGTTLGTKPKVKVNPMRPRTGPYASVITADGTVWARTKPAPHGGRP